MMIMWMLEVYIHRGSFHKGKPPAILPVLMLPLSDGVLNDISHVTQFAC